MCSIVRFALGLLIGLALASACAAPSILGDELDRGSEDETDEPELKTKKKTAPSASAASSAPDAGADLRCTDKVRNGNETGIDCGGSCGPCADGIECRVANDCAGKSCVSGVCCSNAPRTLTTGPSSGTKQLCCPAGATLAAVRDCGVGNNHSVRKVDATCGEAREGSGNNGDACVEITCVDAACSRRTDGGAP
jgi:hypothetical protein